jgi:predicted enzyme related to lactoylglutathione lyase
MTLNAGTWFEIPAADLERVSMPARRWRPRSHAPWPPGMGFFAHSDDSEGNVVGLNAPQ